MADGVAVQIAADVKVEMKGGKLATRTANKTLFKTLILNDGDLKLTNMVLTGASLDMTGITECYIIKNSGTVTGVENTNFVPNAITTHNVYEV